VVKPVPETASEQGPPGTVSELAAAREEPVRQAGATARAPRTGMVSEPEAARVEPTGRPAEVMVLAQALQTGTV
jgi:hypothetical protein